MSYDDFKDSVNPYAQPTASAGPKPGAPGQSPGLGYVRQVNVLAILTMVQGGLLIMMGIFYGMYGAFIGNMPQFMPVEDRRRMQEQGAEIGFKVLFWVMIGIGVLVVLIGLLHLIAGYRNLAYRGRIFSIVTWSLGLIACLTCYCMPTSIGLLVYGAIVFVNPATVRAFALKESGMSNEEIERQFY